MAEAVHSSAPLRSLRDALTPSPALAHAIRFGVAASAAIWIGKAPGLVENNATWILITVLVLMEPTTGGSLLKGLLRAAGTVAAAFTAIGLFLFAQDPPLLMAGFFLVQAVGAYGFSGPRFPYAWLVWAFTTAIVLAPALDATGAVETVAFQRASMVGIGILLVLLVDLLFWPVRAESSLRRSLAARAREAGRALNEAVAALVRSPPRAVAAPQPGSLAQQVPLVAAVRTEIGVSRATADMLQHVAMLLVTLASRTRMLAEAVATPAPLAPQGDAMAGALNDIAARIGAALEEVANALTESRAPTRFPDDLEQALLRLEAQVDRMERGAPGAAALAGGVAELRDIVAVLETLHATLSSSSMSAPAIGAGAWPDFRLDPARVKIALRCGIAVIAAFLVYMALGWPQNALVAPIALMTAATTRGGAKQLLIVFALCLAVAWLLADLMSVYVTPHIGRAPLAMVVPFTVASALAYLGAKRPKLGPLPTLGGLVALLPVFGGMDPPTDVYGAYNTVCYMAVGLGTGWVASRLLWPATAAALFCQRLAVQLGLCVEAVRGAKETGDVDRAQRLGRLIRGFAAQALQLGPLHKQALLEPLERGLDAARRTEILARTTDLADAVIGDRPGALRPLLEGDAAPLRALGEALQRAEEALLGSMKTAVDVLRGDAAYRASGLAAAHQTVLDRLEDLRADPGAIPGLTAEERRRVLVELDARRCLVLRQRAIEDWLEEWQAAERSSQG